MPLMHSWINITAFDLNEKYADTSEVYAQLMSYVTEQLKNRHCFRQDRL